MELRAADYRRMSKASLTGKWGIAIGAYLVAYLLGGTQEGTPFNVSININEEDLRLLSDISSIPAHVWTTVMSILAVVAMIGLTLGIALLIIGSIVGVGYSQFNLDIVDGKEPKFEKLFSWFKSKLWSKAVVTELLAILYIFLWSLLLIIPGIIAAYRYSMTRYILAENPEMSAQDAIARSSEIMEGNKWKLFCLRFSFIGWDLLSILTCGILGFWISPWKNAAVATFYRNLVPLPSYEPVEDDADSSQTFI